MQGAQFAFLRVHVALRCINRARGHQRRKGKERVCNIAASVVSGRPNCCYNFRSLLGAQSDLSKVLMSLRERVEVFDL